MSFSHIAAGRRGGQNAAAWLNRRPRSTTGKQFMTDALPGSAGYVIVGGGVHGLSTAWHLAMELEARGRRSAGKPEILLLDKQRPGAGATGIACGCVRGFYMTEPLHTILRHSVDVWCRDPVLLGYQQVGYISCGEANQVSDYERINASQNRAGYTSELYVGAEARSFLRSVWPDFKCHTIDVVLHEKLSGYAGTEQAVHGLTELCRRHGVRIASGVEVTGYDIANGQVSAVRTDAGEVSCDAVVLGLGAWTPLHWQMLQKPMKIDVGYRDGSNVAGKDMWTYWRLEEGEVYHDEPYYTAEGRNPPVLHIELMTTPVHEPGTGRELRDNVYVYWKNGNERMDRPGIQGGAIPVRIGPHAEVEPYGHANDRYQAPAEFADYFSACMEMFMARFEGARANFRERRNGGICAFTPDNVPIFDWIMPNVYMIADSGHGFKMTGVGKLVARHLASGETVGDLEPFALSRYEQGTAYGSGTTHCPWV